MNYVNFHIATLSVVFVPIVENVEGVLYSSVLVFFVLHKIGQ